MRKLIFCLCCLLWAIPAYAGDLELILNVCKKPTPDSLRARKPTTRGMWFLTKNGGRLLYDDGK